MILPSQTDRLNCTKTSSAIRPTNSAFRIVKASFAIAVLGVLTTPAAFATDLASSDLVIQKTESGAYGSNSVYRATYIDMTASGELIILAQTDGGQRPPGGGLGPDLSQAAAELRISEDALHDALGGPPPDFARAAETLGISEDQLRSVMPLPPRRQ